MPIAEVLIKGVGENLLPAGNRGGFSGRTRRAPDTLTRRRERIAGIHGLSIDIIELYERNMIDELALRLVHGELPVGS